MNPHPEKQPVKLLDQVRNVCNTRQYSIRTEKSYVNWVKQYVLFHPKKHPAELGGAGRMTRCSSLKITCHCVESPIGVEDRLRNAAIYFVSRFARVTVLASSVGLRDCRAPVGRSQ